MRWLFIFALIACTSAGWAQKRVAVHWENIEQNIYLYNFRQVLDTLSKYNEAHMSKKDLLKKYSVELIVNSQLYDQEKCHDLYTRLNAFDMMGDLDSWGKAALAHYHYFVLNDLETSSGYGIECLEMSSMTKNPFFEHMVNFHFSSFIQSGNYEPIIEYFSKSSTSLNLTISDRVDSVQYIIRLVNKAVLSIQHYRYKEALEDLSKAKPYLNSDPLAELPVKYYWNLTFAISCEYINDYTASLEYQMKAQKLGTQIASYYEYMSQAYHGHVLTIIGRREEGMKMLLSAQDSLKKINPLLPIVKSTYMMVASAYAVYNDQYMNKVYLDSALARLFTNIATDSKILAAALVSNNILDLEYAHELQAIALNVIASTPTDSQGAFDLKIATTHHLYREGKFEAALAQCNKWLAGSLLDPTEEHLSLPLVSFLVLRARIYLRLYQRDQKISFLDAAFVDLDLTINRVFVLKKDDVLKNSLVHTENLHELLDIILYEYCQLDGFANSETFELILSDLVALNDFALLKSFYHSKINNSGWNSPLTPRVNLRKIKDYLEPDELVIQYFEGSFNSYVISISQTSQNIRVLESSEHVSLLEKINTSNYHLGLFEQDPISYKHFRDLYSRLYVDLLGPELTFSKQSIQRLTIIPNGSINSVPFELLIEPNGVKRNFKHLNYVFKSYTITYNHSLFALDYYRTSLSEQDFKKPIIVYNWSILDSVKTKTPSQLDHQTQYLPLKLERKVKDEAERLNGELLNQEDLNPQNFEYKLQNHNIIHLSTHGYFDPSRPEHSFICTGRDSTGVNTVTLQEIAQMKINADLAVLPACYSGSAIQVGDEGALSIAKAFSLAGCTSTIVNRWQVSDLVSSLVINKFYDSIGDGKTPSRALQLSLANFIATQNDPLLLHPYLWGGFSAMGKNSTIVLSLDE